MGLEDRKGKIMATIGDRIREIREKRKMTQDELAQTADISKGFLSDVENDKRNVSSQILLRIANSLGASINYLLTGETKEPMMRETINIPPELSLAAQELELSYTQTLELLDADRSIVARRSNKSLRNFTVEDWKELHKAIKKVYG
jgi:transcriptional regulator with XRE-family HTH domain